VYGGVTGAAVALVVLMGAFVLRDRSNAGVATGADPPPVGFLAGAGGDNAPAPITEGRRNAIVSATRRVAPAVVSVTVTHEQQVRYWELYRDWDYFFPRRRLRKGTQVSRSFGSGVIIDRGGYLFTNNHVIGANVVRIEVQLSDGTPIRAELLGKSPQHDLALLKIDPSAVDAPLPVAKLGDSAGLVVGEWAIAIGSPFGQYLADTQPTVTVGVISALHRDIRQSGQEDQIFSDMIQTDAAINPGNSGGPLVNADGEVVGINTVIFSGVRGESFNIGLGFAIPINRARYVLGEIIEHGEVREQWIGMTASNITPQIQVSLELPVDKGVLIRGTDSDGPAARAGVKPGDVLITIDGVTIVDTEHANRLLFAREIGDIATMVVSRDDELLEIEVRIEARPDPGI